MTSCGETSERKAAMLHGAICALYLLALAWHAGSILTHLRRERFNAD